MYQNQTPPAGFGAPRMILDSLSNLRLYRTVHPLLPVVSEFIFGHDCGELEPGKISLGHGITVGTNEYFTTAPESCRLECHRKFVDLQLVLSGVEEIGYACSGNCSPLTPYDREKDVEFFTGIMNRITLQPGLFALFFPQDAHMPGLVSGAAGCSVRKMVAKIPVV